MVACDCVLQAGDKGRVTLVYDKKTDAYSMGLKASGEMSVKFISKELYELLMEELKDQDSFGPGRIK